MQLLQAIDNSLSIYKQLLKKTRESVVGTRSELVMPHSATSSSLSVTEICLRNQFLNRVGVRTLKELAFQS